MTFEGMRSTHETGGAVDIREAQRDVRQTFLGGAVGQTVAGGLGLFALNLLGIGLLAFFGVHAVLLCSCGCESLYLLFYARLC